MTNPQESKIKLLEAIPSDKLYPIYNDLRKYYNKWDKDQVIELADTAGIENFYTITQYLTRTVPVVGAGLAVQGETQTGVIIAGISLYTDYLITRGKEKLFKSEEKKEKLTEFSKDIENIYDRHQELVEILKPLRNSDSLLELNELLNALREELSKITEKKPKEESNKSRLRNCLGYIFWSLHEKNNNEFRELALLSNGIKDLDSWNKVAWTTKAKSEFSRLFISLRERDPLWAEWKQEWEIRRSEHEKIKHLISILQTAISEHKQGISSVEIEGSIKNEMLGLEIGKNQVEDNSLEKIEIAEEDIQQEQIVALIEQHPKKE